jgi:hypothetical protein
MLSIQVKIERAQRLVQMLEQDAPLLAKRFAELPAERHQNARNYAETLAAHARAELMRLQEEHAVWEMIQSAPQAAD